MVEVIDLHGFDDPNAIKGLPSALQEIFPSKTGPVLVSCNVGFIRSRAIIEALQ